MTRHTFWGPYLINHQPIKRSVAQMSKRQPKTISLRLTANSQRPIAKNHQHLITSTVSHQKANRKPTESHQQQAQSADASPYMCRKTIELRNLTSHVRMLLYLLTYNTHTHTCVLAPPSHNYSIRIPMVYDIMPE